MTKNADWKRLYLQLEESCHAWRLRYYELKDAMDKISGIIQTSEEEVMRLILRKKDEE